MFIPSLIVFPQMRKTTKYKTTFKKVVKEKNYECFLDMIHKDFQLIYLVE